ncbi:hypothetical protein [Stagnihabitans tardus]|uniref:Uncharacterized protein n=1 Tax=Stagnihabitans tardus TaxID=2699202 RepID=A0AAE4YDJ8_9RHOB|nr:hypothetical protein [Stagnihabitans tardus]NBZ89486.1 hypothetical protein [Stagnihabitans tardus]
MIPQFLAWLEGHVFRWHGLNALMFTLVLWLSGPARSALGLAALGLMALWSLRSMGRAPRLHPFDLALGLVPQAMALSLAALALHLSGEWPWLLALYGLQLGLVAIWNETLSQGRAHEVRLPAWVEAQ